MIRIIVKTYMLLLLLDTILSFFPETYKHPWRLKLKKICDYTCEPIRRFLPSNLPFDFSPMIVIFTLTVFLEVFIYVW